MDEEELEIESVTEMFVKTVIAGIAIADDVIAMDKKQNKKRKKRQRLGGSAYSKYYLLQWISMS